MTTNRQMCNILRAFGYEARERGVEGVGVFEVAITSANDYRRVVAALNAAGLNWRYDGRVSRMVIEWGVDVDAELRK